MLPKQIQGDQVGFVPSRQAGDNTRQAINLINLLIKTNCPALVLRLDVQKDLDPLSWPFMFATLSHCGFVGLLKALQALYSRPTSQVQVASFLLHSFTVSNGTRQGCPLLLIFTFNPMLGTPCQCYLLSA